MKSRPRCSKIVLRTTCILVLVATSSAHGAIRIVEYNTDISDTGVINPPASMISVIQAIGAIHLGDGIAPQPIDVLALTELSGGTSSATANTTQTLKGFVDALNGIYGAGTYAFDPLIGQTESVSSDGPSGLVYNTKTIKDVGSIGIGPVGTSGAPRQPMRYELQPVGYGNNSNFYMYVDHYKSGTGSTNANRRNIEAQEVRTDADALGANTHIIYSGDFNMTTSSEAAYQTTLAAGNGQAYDPANPAENWTASSSFTNILTMSRTLSNRYDMQLPSNAVNSVNNQPGLQLIANSITAFGNNGSVPFGSAINVSANTALNDLGSNAGTILNDLNAASDHLPIVAHYSFTGVYLTGDANGDGHVDLNDLNTVLNNLGTTNSAWWAGNFDGAGTIDLTDLNDVLNQGNRMCHPVSSLRR